MIWSAVGFVAEVPTGALADRFSRRAALVASSVLIGCGYALWTALPSFPAFAAGFALWSLGGALASGAFEALLYDGLAAAGERDRYPTLYGRIEALRLLAQLPAAGAATLLFAAGGYQLVGWASVASCLGSALLATRLPEPPRRPAGGADDADADADDAGDAGYLATLRAGLAEAAGRPAVRTMLIAVAVVSGLDAIEEYFSLLAVDWGVPAAWVPVALIGIPLAGAAGAALGGRAGRLRSVTLGALFAAGVLVFGLAGLLRTPAGLIGIAAFYLVYRMVAVVLDARLQTRIDGAARATVTSVAGLGIETVGLLVFAAWAVGEVLLVSALMLLVAIALPRWSGRDKAIGMRD